MVLEMLEKKLLNRLKHSLSRIDPLVLPAFFVSLPVAWFTMSLVLCLLWTFLGRSKSLEGSPSWLFYGFLSLFLLYFVGIWDVENPEPWLYKIRGKLFYVLIPLAFLRREFKFEQIKRAWILGLLTAIAMISLAAIIKLAAGADLGVFYYGQLAFYAHPSYLSFIAIVALLFNYQIAEKEYIRMAIGVLILFMLYLLSARAMQLALVPVLFLMLINNLRRPQRLKMLVLSIFISGGFALGMHYLTQGKMNRVKEVGTAISNKQAGGDSKSSTAVRIDMWSSVWNHREEFIPFGVGAGNVEAFLAKIWDQDGLDYLNTKGYNNIHNQYLQHLVAVGVLGLALLLALMASALGGFSFNNNWLPLSYFTLIFIGLLFECLMERQMGISTIVFLICLLHQERKYDTT